MEKRKSTVERLLIAGLAVLLVALLVGGGTLARVTRQGVAENVISSGEIKVKLLNQTRDGEDMPEIITCIVPGDTLDNTVKVKNVCDYGEYIRISLDKVIYETADEEVILDDSKASFLFNEEDWTYQDGYYYYNEELKPGEVSNPLYDGIYMSETMGNEYKVAVMDVLITVEAVQSINNGDAFTAEGWEKVASFGKPVPEIIVDETETEVESE